jgi:hypothetical protein
MGCSHAEAVGMTTIAVRAKFRATTLHVGDLVRHACSTSRRARITGASVS